MSLLEAFRAALQNLAAHKLRSALSMLGMIFGVGAVIAMLSIGKGAERQALSMVERLGLRNVIVRAREIEREELEEIRKQSPGLAPRDVEAVREGVPGVRWVVPRVHVETYAIFSAHGKSEARVTGVSALEPRITPLPLQRGRFLDAADEQAFAQVAVLSARAWRDLFGGLDPLGRPVKINDVWFHVVGVLESGAGESGAPGVEAGSTHGEIYVPATTAVRKFDRDPLKGPLDALVVHTESGVSPYRVSRAVDGLLERLHAGVRDFEMVVPEQLLEQSRRTQRLFSIVMGAIAGISLLVGGIGIMNIMLASVLERTREIGIRRAVGARRRDIRNQFVIEAFTISLLGGLAGVGAGLLLAWAVAAMAGWPTVVTPLAVAAACGVSVTVGILSGLYPALRAAELDPVEALRYE